MNLSSDVALLLISYKRAHSSALVGFAAGAGQREDAISDVPRAVGARVKVLHVIRLLVDAKGGAGILCACCYLVVQVALQALCVPLLSRVSSV